VMTAKMGGIDDVVGFPWPAAFEPTTTELDQSAVEARKIFRRELVRADAALRAGGAVDHDGHPTSFGKELTRFQGLGSTSSALAILYADRLACVPEVATILALLEDKRLIGKRGLLQDDFEWPDEWRLEAAERHRALANVCEDDAHLVLLITAAWERADERVPPWERSEKRQRWARRWWVSNEVLIEAAEKRQELLASLSPAMKEEVKRFIEPALLDRARSVITRAFAAQSFRRTGEDQWESVAERVLLDDDQGLETNDQGSPVEVRQPRERITAGLEDDHLTRPIASTVVALRRREVRDDNRISNLVALAEWATPSPGAGQATGVRDAMRMVVLTAREAPPNQKRDLPLHLMRSWPIGQRVRLRWVDGVPQIDEGAQIIPPFVRPKTEDELDKPRYKYRRSRRRPALDFDEPDATRDDTAGDFGTVGPQDNRAQDAAEVAAAERQQVADLACGSCFPCLDGRFEDCEEPQAGFDVRSKMTDPLQSWRAQARNGMDVSAPTILVDGDSTGPDGWYEVTGYGVEGEAPEVLVRPDWRPEGFRGNPAQHLGVTPGQPIVVTVGPQTRHHGGPVRAFVRSDGGGRFLVREASSYKDNVQKERREIALSLDRGTTGLLQDLVEGQALTATVVPARADGCYTITLLELLYQHWEKAAAGRGYESHVLDPTRRNARREKVYNAEIELPPNDFGFVTAILRHQDVARGIKHRFSFKVLPRESGDQEEAVSPSEEARTMDYPSPVLLHLNRDYAQLDVGALDLDELEAIEKSEAGGLKLLDARGSDDIVDDDAEGEAEDGARYAAPGAVLKSVSSKPISRKAVAALAALDESAAWQNEVWAFWARSHHLQVDRKSPYIAGKPTEVFDFRSEVDVDEGETNAERIRRLVAEYLRDHPVNSVVEAEVEQITDGAVFVKLQDGLDGRVPVSELSWGFTEHASEEVHPGKMLRLLITEATEDPPRVTLSVRALLPKPYVEYKVRHTVGDKVDAEVDRVSKSHVTVRLSNGALGVVHVRNLRWERVEDATALYKRGDTVKAVILKFDDEKEQLELSIKALLPKPPNPYVVFKQSHQVGMVVSARVTGMNRSFAYVSLDGGAEGSIHVSKLASQRIADPSAAVVRGQSIRATIIGWDDQRSKVELSTNGVRAEATMQVDNSRSRSATASSVPRPAPGTPPSLPNIKKSAIGEGRTVEEASAAASSRLGLSLSQVTLRVLQQPQVGLFGRLKNMAIVEATEL
jgi:predicted RNA-binding protein with RPS1 domain